MRGDDVAMKFSYKVVEAPSPTTPEKLTTLLNALGKQGYELCTTNYGWLIFKRRLR